jgi:hypothetical protein
VLRIFGPKRKEVSGGWEELYNLYASPNTVRVIESRMLRWLGHVAHMLEMRSAYKILVRKPEGKRPLGGSRHTWEDNIRIDLRKIEWEVVD